MELHEETRKMEADLLRVQIMKMSDDDLIYYSRAVHAENFETIPERIKRVSKEYIKSMPF